MPCVIVITTVHVRVPHFEKMRKEDDSSNGNDEDEDEDEDVDKPVALCASCDRCRARKTRCDGKRPCSHCISKHIKKNNLKRCVHRIHLEF